MFERVITQTIQRISSEVLRDRQSVPLAEILEDERIPSRFKPFFATEVRWWLYNDALARNANKRFDCAHPEVASLLDYLEQVMFRHARFEHDEFVSTLDGAVKLTFNYLCRPQTTLKWYIFRGQPVKPLSEVMLRFESFLDYEYIGNVFAEWVEQKVRERSTFEAISATEFERIIRRIDDQILLSCTVDELLALLDPIFDFIGEGEEQNVPLDALIIFFDDKNIARLVDHLERYRQPNATVSRARFVGILEELLTSAEENPEADFSSVYQNDELDDIVRRHLEADGKFGAYDQQPVDEASLDPRPSQAAPQTAQRPAAEQSDARPDAAAPTQPQSAQQPAAHGQLPSQRQDPAPTQPTTPVPEPAEPQPPREEPPAPAPVREEPPREEPPREEPTRDQPPARAPGTGEPAMGMTGDANQPSTVDVPANAAPASTATSPDDVAAQRSNTSPVGSDRIESPDGMVGRDKGRAVEPAIPITEVATIDDVVSRLEESSASIEEVAGDRSRSTSSTVASSAAASGEAVATTVGIGLDPMLERKVLKKIFARDRAAYDAAIGRIASADSWRGARQIIDELFIRYDVDPYSRTATRFVESIQTRFVPKSHN